MSSHSCKTVRFINYSDTKGGAAKAAWRLYSLLKGSEVFSVEFHALHRNQTESVPAVRRYKIIAFLVYNFLSRFYLGVIRFSQGVSYQKRSINYFGVLELNDDVIYHLNWVHNELISLHSVLNSNRPIFWTLHDSWFFNSVDNCDAEKLGDTFLTSYIHNLKSRIVRDTSIHFIVPNSTAAIRFQRRFDVDGRCTVVPNPVSFDEFKFDSLCFRREGFLNLIFVASDVFDPIKGWDVLVKAIELLDLKNRANISIKIVGKSSVKSSLDHLNLAKVEWLGVVTDSKKLSSLMTTSDFLIVPSLSESFGQVAAEAIASGTPVVASKTDGLIDLVVHDYTGFLFDIGDEKKLSEILSSLFYMKRSAYEIMVNSGYNKIKNYCSTELVKQKILDLYREKF